MRYPISYPGIYARSDGSEFMIRAGVWWRIDRDTREPFTRFADAKMWPISYGEEDHRRALAVWELYVGTSR